MTSAAHDCRLPEPSLATARQRRMTLSVRGWRRNRGSCERGTSRRHHPSPQRKPLAPHTIPLKTDVRNRSSPDPLNGHVHTLEIHAARRIRSLEKAQFPSRSALASFRILYVRSTLAATSRASLGALLGRCGLRRAWARPAKEVARMLTLTRACVA